MVSRTLVAGLLCLTAVAACRLEYLPPGQAQADTETLQGIITAFHESLAAEDWDTFQALFAEHASVSATVGVSQTVGGFWNGVQAWRHKTGASEFAATPSQIDLRHSGNVATAWLTSTWTADPSGISPTVMEHRAVFVFTRQGDRWRLVSTLLDRRSPAAVS